MERSTEDETRLTALVDKQEAFCLQHDGMAEDELPAAVAARLAALASATDARSEPAYLYPPEVIARPRPSWHSATTGPCASSVEKIVVDWWATQASQKR